MDIERTLRLACAAPDPGPAFEETVMARVGAAAWRATQAAPRKSRRIVLIGVLFAGAAAAAILVAQYSGSSPPPALAVQAVETAATQIVSLAAPAIAPSAVPVSGPVAAATPPPLPPAAPNSTDTAQLCTAAAAAPPAAPRYTVLVQPLKFDTSDPVIQSRVQEYYGALLDSLRRVPGLALAGREADASKPADFRITVTETKGFGGGPMGESAALSLSLEAWNGTAFASRMGTVRQIRTLDNNNCPSGPAPNCGPAGAAAIDVSVGLSQLPRYPTTTQLACNRAIELDFQQRRADPTYSISMVRQGLERIAGMPELMQRNSMWSILRSNARPELAQPLATALRESTDDAFRKEAMTLLAVKYADDPAARQALAAVAASAPDTLMRHVAERAVSGEAPWRDYAVVRVRDTSLPTPQRLEAWYWMVDAMALDTTKMSNAMVEALTALQAGNGVRVLADLLAASQKDPAGPGYGLAGQQDQWAMRRIGSVNHPAAPELLIACFDAMPNYITLGVLATRRDDPRVVSRLEAVAADETDPRLSKQAISALRAPLSPALPAPTGN
jgi:hypothetical protein